MKSLKIWNAKIWGIAIFAIFMSPALATETSSTAGLDNDPVFAFNRICYAQVPNLEAIGEMARKLAWHPMDNDDLEEFKTGDQTPQHLEGWDVQVGEQLYRVGVTRTSVSEEMVDTFPEFAGGSATSCSMILDENVAATTFMPNMQILADREPIQTNKPDGPLLSTMWGGGNDDYKIFLFAKTPENGKGGLLNVLILSKQGS